MKCLTVWQPWAWAISAGLKLVENRDWFPSWKQLKPGDELAIHGGMHEPTREDLYAVRDAARKIGRESEVPGLGGQEFSVTYGRGRVLAVARFEGFVDSSEKLTAVEAPWFVGRYGWRLADVRQLNLGTAPQVKGAQGLWELPAGVEDMVRRQLVAHHEGQLWRRTA
jgi:hypothetical protein